MKREKTYDYEKKGMFNLLSFIHDILNNEQNVEYAKVRVYEKRREREKRERKLERWRRRRRRGGGRWREGEEKDDVREKKGK